MMVPRGQSAGADLAVSHSRADQRAALTGAAQGQRLSDGDVRLEVGPRRHLHRAATGHAVDALLDGLEGAVRRHKRSVIQVRSAVASACHHRQRGHK